METADVIGSLAALSASLTAIIVLLHSGLWRLGRGLLALAAVSALGEALILWQPAIFWTSELFLAWNCGLALLAVLAALELGRGVLRPAARVWRGVCQRGALLLVPLAAIGVVGLLGMSSTPRVGYRGLLVLDVAVAGVFAVVLVAISLYELPRQRVAVTALRGLMRYFALQALCLGAWEWHPALARATGWLAYASYVWAMLAVARDAWSTTDGPVLQAVRVTK